MTVVPLAARPPATGPPTTGPLTTGPPTTAVLVNRYARLIAGRRSKWLVLVFWLLLIGVGGSLASKLGSVENNAAQTWLPAKAESTHALNVADQRFAGHNVSTAVVVYARHGGLTAVDLAKVTADRTLLARGHLSAAAVAQPTMSADRQAALLSVPLGTSPSDSSVLGDAVDRLRTDAHARAPAGLDIRVSGPAGNAADYIHVFSGLDTTLLAATIGVVALLLLLTYRSPVLFLVPLISVALASQIAAAIVYLFAKHAGLLVNGESASVLTVLVLGVGTDYALLLIARYREELHRHEDRHNAMAAALRRCLPAIAASAATVIIAALCLLLGSMNSTRGLGPVAAIGVATAFAAMTTLLPALLVIVGRRAFWPFIPRYSPQPEATTIAGQHRLWSRIARTVARAPRPIWIGTALVLGALALGSTTLHTGQTQADQFTSKVDSVAGQQLITQHFPAGSSAPAEVYVPTAQARRTLAALAHVDGVSTARSLASADGWTQLSATLTAEPDTHAAQQSVTRIRTTLRQLPGEHALVGSQSATALDTATAQTAEEKLLIPLILAIVLIILCLLLRALIAPLVLLGSVVLSYAAALGSAALLYHALGHPRIDRGLLLFGFLFLVALGVDYTIFLMTRAREEVQQHGHRDGILTGLTVTGGVITSAGLVLAATFTVLAVLPVVSSLQQGLLIAVGVLLDTFLVRSLLIPALALDLGPRIWRPGHPDATPERRPDPIPDRLDARETAGPIRK